MYAEWSLELLKLYFFLFIQSYSMPEWYRIIKTNVQCLSIEATKIEPCFYSVYISFLNAVSQTTLDIIYLKILVSFKKHRFCLDDNWDVRDIVLIKLIIEYLYICVWRHADIFVYWRYCIDIVSVPRRCQYYLKTLDECPLAIVRDNSITAIGENTLHFSEERKHLLFGE